MTLKLVTMSMLVMKSKLYLRQPHSGGFRESLWADSYHLPMWHRWRWMPDSVTSSFKSDDRDEADTRPASSFCLDVFLDLLRLHLLFVDFDPVCA
ncbi:hypothetical protein PI126_g12791 [Phytophthora idaei]|nr:hypothetical protein PI126_g12791 [Phytophthora idaei]